MRLPDNTERVMIVGQNGSGKTQAGVWHLSNAPFDRMPYIIFDWKRDELIGRLNATPIAVGEIPTQAGLYVVRPFPGEDDEMVSAMLRAIWAQEYTGLYFDEGYMVPDDGPLAMILTQGRSKRVPVIMLSQRPVWLSRFAFSEAGFFQLFRLSDKRDRKTVLAFMPSESEDGAPIDYDEVLPPFHSYFYDVKKNKIVKLAPVPSADELVEKINAKIPERRKKRIFGG